MIFHVLVVVTILNYYDYLVNIFLPLNSKRAGAVSTFSHFISSRVGQTDVCLSLSLSDPTTQLAYINPLALNPSKIPYSLTKSIFLSWHSSTWIYFFLTYSHLCTLHCRQIPSSELPVPGAPLMLFAFSSMAFSVLFQSLHHLLKFHLDFSMKSSLIFLISSHQKYCILFHA